MFRNSLATFPKLGSRYSCTTTPYIHSPYICCLGSDCVTILCNVSRTCEHTGYWRSSWQWPVGPWITTTRLKLSSTRLGRNLMMKPGGWMLCDWIMYICIFLYIFVYVCIKSSMLYEHSSPGGLNRYDSDLRDTRTVAISGAGFRPARSVGGGGLRFRLSIRAVGWLHDGVCSYQGAQDPHIWGSYFIHWGRSVNLPYDFVGSSRCSYSRCWVQSFNFPYGFGWLQYRILL